VDLVKGSGASAFLDLKFHDIPATVSLSVIAAANLGVDLVNVHALGGRKMMYTVMSDLDAHCTNRGIKRPKVIAVTVLTSLTTEELQEVGIDATPTVLVTHLAKLSKACGLDGVVSSPEEIKLIKEQVGHDTLVVTPGVRPTWADADDQRRIMTPGDAIRAGADYLVVGRPILKHADPLGAANKILDEIASAL
jgi:orotidine-5'-phosphate decarboxylase